MLWKLCPSEAPAARDEPIADQGRFVVHRHTDAQGPHLDLRLEAGPCLVGWRVDGVDLLQERYAVEKPPHPLQWLERNGDAVRDNAGTYVWVEHDDDGGVLELRGETSVRWLRVHQARVPSPSALGALLGELDEHGVELPHVTALIQDGRLARQRALMRLCALGRELDGTTFDETRWKNLLGQASLDEIHHHLRAYEVRFDAKYPPQPVSQPEPLPDEDDGHRRDNAWAILQSA